MKQRLFPLVSILALVVLCAGGCSVRKFAINKIGSAIASGGSTYTSDDDVEMVSGALPFAIKLVEGMLSDVPKNKELQFAAAQAITSYAYLAVQPQIDQGDSDFDQRQQLRQRARRLYLRAHAHAMAGLDIAHPGFRSRFESDPRGGAAALKKNEVPLIYWTAASLGLAISASRDDVDLISRIPQVDALLERALSLDEGWNFGALHEFEIVLAGARPGSVDYANVRRHYDRALELSGGKSASLFVTYAESVSEPLQKRTEFLDLLERALGASGKDAGDLNLTNAVADRRARWLKDRIDDLILDTERHALEGKDNL
jgi:TRAP transporter T-component